MVEETSEYFLRKTRQRVIDGDPNLTRLEFPDGQYFDAEVSSADCALSDLLAALRKHREACAVRRGKIPPTLVKSVIQNGEHSFFIQLVRIIGALPAIEEIEIESPPASPFEMVQFSLSSILAQLSRLCQLKSLVLNTSSITLSELDVEDVAASLRTARTLEEFSLRSLGNVAFSSRVWNALVDALGTLPHLRKIHLAQKGPGYEPAIDETCLTNMLVSGPSKGTESFAHICEVRLENFGLRDSHMEALAEGLGICSSTMMAEAATTTAAAAAAPKIRSIEFMHAYQVTGRGCEALCRAMEQQYTIAKLWVDFSKPRAFQQQQRTGESDTDSLVLRRRDHIMTLCALNGAGRGEIVQNQNVSRGEWVELLATARNDLDALFGLLLTRPSMCCCYPAKASKTTATVQSKKSTFLPDIGEQRSAKRQRVDSTKK